MKKALFLFLYLLTGSIGLSAQTKLESANPTSVNVSKDRLQRIDKLLKTYIDSNFIKGAVGLIARNGKIIYNRSFGISDEKKLETDAVFRIASQTKAITSVAVMILFEEGKFLLDDPISKYIPEFSKPTVLKQLNEKDTTYSTVPAKREITIRDLLTHTSGIDYPVIGSSKMVQIYAKNNIPAGFVSDKRYLKNEIKILAKLPLSHQPGEKFTYGLSTDVLGYLVEVLSGKTFDGFLHERIFEPLEMNDTYFYLPSNKKARLVKVTSEDGKSHHAIKYVKKEGDIPVDYPLSNGTYFSGGAGLSSTVYDYAIFLQMLLNGGTYNGKRILARHTVDLMTTNQIGDLSLDKNKFGLGFEITTKAGEAKLGTSEGSFAWGGFWGTTYWADPKEKLVCLLFLQQFPLSHGEVFEKFKVLVYQALND